MNATPATGELVGQSPEVPFQVITPADVRASIRRARRGLERAAEEIVWQIEREAWRTLGYSSWTAMREAEYGGAAVMVPTGSRQRITARLKELPVGKTARGGDKHLTDQEVADTLGVSARQVGDDLNGNNKSGSSADFVETDDDVVVVDAEIVEDDEPTSNAATGPTPASADPEPITTTCPTCKGTGEVTR